MRSLKDTAAATLPEPEPNQGKYLKAEQVLGYPLLALGANIGTTQWGERVYLKVEVLGDPDHTEYTIGFSDRSHAYQQLTAMIDAENKRVPQFPLTLSVGEWGKSYKLVEMPEIPNEHVPGIVASVKMACERNQRERADSTRENPTNRSIPF